ncbi:hypothetical protein CY34DRAFT_146265 [Suillus luteus UH-Slu-Lm8-n1]|uniref:Uncharacterized protein n=1 Tax=Suillus luteus UH-Slu-Lm8-n1 TaxID=930992 RepID=A0A0D0B7J6_9AGAM|nr:hypothetical protein CY34DRAFT_146265 [Suillus luteus UH-Slu-Lm8-n1]
MHIVSLCVYGPQNSCQYWNFNNNAPRSSSLNTIWISNRITTAVDRRRGPPVRVSVMKTRCKAFEVAMAIL